VFTHIEPEDCPPYESAYGFVDVFRQTDVMADVAGFYRAHGLVVGGTERERPDNVVTELEFMSFMARKEAVALDQLGADEVDECRRTQASFLRDHLGCWGPDFGRRVSLLTDHPLLRASGALLARWIEADLAAFGVEPAERRHEPAPRPLPDDGTCGMPCDGEFDAEPVPVEFMHSDEAGGAR
jgi:TorA maturation chaperone TorD